MPDPLRDPSRLFAPPKVVLERRADGSMLLRSPEPLQPYPRVLGEHLERWARRAPDRPFLQERGPDGRWRGPTYAQALAAVRRIATGLIRRDLGPERPVAILSDNGVDHALLTLAAMHVGIPVVPVSPAYSLMSRDFGKLRAIIALADPALLYVADQDRHAPALDAIRDVHGGLVVASHPCATGDPALAFDELGARSDAAAVARRFGELSGDSVAKLLFTSGSTGEPKGVINTQRMLCASQQARSQVWPFLAAHPPVIVDWLPWSHTFGANHNFNLVLHHGGTLYIDGGRPVPPLFGQTRANLADVAPTIYFNVPRGYDLLVAALKEDAELRRNFFRRLQVIFYAAAALPQHLWDALGELAQDATGGSIPLTSGWGATETAPLATDCHFQADQAGVIGIPVPGTALKLVPNGPKLEVRVKGPNVTPGYWKRPDLTAASFDGEGFYRIGDAVRFVDPERPERGLLFDGRVAEDFKLDTGTWVSVGMLRVKAVAALAPVAQDVVVTGQDRPGIGLLIFPNVAGCRSLCTGLPDDASIDEVMAHPAVREAVRRGLGRLREAGGGSASYAARALFLTDPPSIDLGEITDKGYLNQQAVRANRVAAVAALEAEPPGPGVILLEA